MIFSQNKQKYAFILGQVPALSKAEIAAVLNHQNIEFAELFSDDHVLVIESKKLSADELQERLGGTIKISNFQLTISKKFPIPPALLREAGQANSQFIDKIFKLVIKRFKDLKIKDKKFQFGFSVYGELNQKALQKIGLEIKRHLQSKKIKSRLVVSKEPALSSVIVQKEKLIDQGVDIVIIPSAEEYYIGYTVSVQKFAEYSERDYGRPQRDDKSGMLPPKLAKMMFNLSQTDFNQTILDPFCGSGTVIQEAIFLGYKKIIGSDISDKAVSDTLNNLEWLKTKFRQDLAGVKIFKQDVRELFKKIQRQSIDCIVTEPYLGPVRANSNLQDTSYKKDQRSKIQDPNIIYELSKLYLTAFEEFYKVLRKEGKIVVIFPIINGQKLEILNDIKRLGFVTEPIGPEPRKSIIYSRPQQRVKREIFVFRKI